MSRLAKIAVVSLSLLVFSYVGLGYVLGKSDDDKTYRSLTVYGEVLQRVQEDYVDEPNMSAVTAGALHGLLESLDPYSGYLSSREYSDYKDKQKNATHGEIGATVAKRFGYVVVVSVLPDGPAEKAGLALRRHSRSHCRLHHARHVRRPGQPAARRRAGHFGKVDVVRRGRTEPQPMDLPRAMLAMPHVTADKIDDDVPMCASPRWSGRRRGAARKAAAIPAEGRAQARARPSRLRQRPMSEGIAAAQLFVPSGTVAVLSGQTVTRQEFPAAADKVVWRDPVEVLISDSTSGAAEVVAAALGNNHRADLVGQRTFGSASEQKVIPLEDGAALVLTVAYYYTPAGKPIIDQGVPATVEVAPPLPDLTDDTARLPLRFPPVSCLLMTIPACARRSIC